MIETSSHLRRLEETLLRGPFHGVLRDTLKSLALLLLAACACFVLAQTSLWSFNPLSSLALISWPLVGVNIAYWTLPAIALSLLFARPRHILLAPLLLTLLLAIINTLKIRYLHLPIAPSDIQFWTMIPFLARFVGTPLLVVIALSLIALISLAWWAARSRRHGTIIDPPARLRFFPRFLAALLLFPAVFPSARTLALHNTLLYQPLKEYAPLSPMGEDPLDDARRNGLMIAWLWATQDLRFDRPDTYNTDALNEILGAFPEPPAPVPVAADQPHVIVLMIESFVDPAWLDLTLSADPAPTFHVLASLAPATHRLVSPVFGGKTPNVEWEVLTGIPMKSLPAGLIPFQTLIRRPVHSLARLFKQHGYATLGLHNNTRTFWHRDRVYPALGFDSFLGLEEMNDTRLYGNFSSDAVLFDTILKTLDSATRPHFIYATTMTMHGPYNGHIPESPPPVRLLSNDNPQTTNWLNLMRHTDASLNSFLLSLSERHLRDKVSLIIFGDHQSHMSGTPDAPHRPAALWGNTSSLPPDLPLDQLSKHLVPLVVLPAGDAQFHFPPIASAWCLPPAILSMANIEPSPFFAWNASRCMRTPVLTPASNQGDNPTEETQLLSTFRAFAWGQLTGDPNLRIER